MAFASDSTTAPARPLLPLVAGVPVRPRDARGRFAELPPEPLLPEADLAQVRHLRRQLEAAAEHGAALLSALGLPRLVTANFIQIDPVVAGDALDQAIAALDALDAPDEDREPWLGYLPPPGCALDAEGDTEEDEGTALESFGKGFVRAGADDAEDDDPAEDSDPAERDDDHGNEDEPYLWRFERPDAVQRAAWLCEVARHV